MDYDNQTHLWEKSGNHLDSTRRRISSLTLPLRDTNNQLSVIYHEETQTMIKVSYDESNTRTLIRTKTTPNTKPPKKLIAILEEQKFKKII